MRNRVSIVLFFLLILAALFIRIYRTDQILGFYFDQGRDALVIRDLIINHKFFLIGPTTGIAGIFRGPWYYWLITPFYFLGKGNPVWPAVFLALTTVVANLLIYKLTKDIGGRRAGILACLIASLSYYLLLAARWLSNPTPMLLISMLLVYSLFLIIDGKKWAWLLTGLMLGLAMQFGSAAEIFYFPAVFVFAIWQYISPETRGRNLPDKKIVLGTVCVFLITLLPQLVFDARHNAILTKNILNFLIGDGSFKLSFWQVVKLRLPFYFGVFSSKIFPVDFAVAKTFGLVFTFLLIANFDYLKKSPKFLTLILLFTAPLLGMLFFQGNFGNVYDYYFTGYYLIFVMIVSLVLALGARNTLGKILLYIFVLLFIGENLPLDKNYILAGVDGPTTIALGNQKQSIEWIYQDANTNVFNVDEYVPPVIPYAYNYLFRWYGDRTGKYPSDNNVSLLYTLYEVDPPHPERLEAWLKRQDGIGKVISQKSFGGITVQKRLRISRK